MSQNSPITSSNLPVSFPLFSEFLLVLNTLSSTNTDIIHAITNILTDKNNIHSTTAIKYSNIINDFIQSFINNSKKINEFCDNSSYEINLNEELDKFSQLNLFPIIHKLKEEYEKKLILDQNNADIQISENLADSSNNLLDPSDLLISRIFGNMTLDFNEIEFNGKYVDLNEFYRKYINLPQYNRETDYTTYLRTFTDFQSVKRSLKVANKDYENYLKSLLNYMKHYIQKLYPLLEIKQVTDMIQIDFDEKWKSKQLTGWLDSGNTENQTESNKNGANKENKNYLAQADTNPNENNPLWCRYCEKLFAKDTVYKAHLTGKPHKRAELGLKHSGKDNSYDIAYLETQIIEFAKLLHEQIEGTITYIIKKQTRTVDETLLDRKIELEMEEKANNGMIKPDTVMNEDKNNDTSKTNDNQQNHPLGWDGKPIPPWLYKLNQLNHEYRCEICGNYSYRGPKAFLAHFNDFRHSYGMKCLDIPNTSHFIYVTKIADAQALWAKLQAEQNKNDFNSDDEEEFEDSEGNVFKKKTYLELQRQGLL